MKKRGFKEIHRRSQEYNKTHPQECSYFNWVARMVAYVEFGKKVYPEPKKKEVKAFKKQRFKL